MNKTGNQKYQDNEQQIQDTFLALLQEKDIAHITVQEICRTANLNRSTFYRHHEDIYALMEQIQKTIFIEFLEEFRSQNPKNNFVTPDNLTLIIQHILKHKNFYRTYLSSRKTIFSNQNDSHLWEEYFVPMFQSYGIENERHMRYFYEYFHSGLVSCIQKWLKDGCIETPEELSSLLWHYSMHEEVSISSGIS